jgi:hypothetical protein
MLYFKIIDGQEVISPCTTLKIDGRWVSNPTEEMILADGWLPYTPPPVIPQPELEPDYYAVLENMKKWLVPATGEMTDEEALEVAALFQTWASKLNGEDPSQPGQWVEAGERLWYDGELWKVLQPHQVMQSWNPRDAVSLFVRVSIEEWPEWVQPVGSTDAYAKDAQVTHKDQHWISEIDGNVWEPGVYGWTIA